MSAHQARINRLQSNRVNRSARVNNVAAGNRVNTANALRGRFANARANTARTFAAPARAAGLSPTLAWRRGWRAAFIPWFGPLFWPYAYWDIFYYPFWPYAYDDIYWAYLYDDFFDGIFWPYGDGPVEAYAHGGGYGPGPAYGSGPLRRARYGGPSENRRVVRELCSDPGRGITAWPFAEIERTVDLTDEQRGLLQDLRTAATEAANDFKASCGSSYPMTPPGRLQSMINRVDATLAAVRVVKPALGKFYDSLSDEQKARFNAIGPRVGRTARAHSEGTETAAADCREPKSGLTTLPIERIGAVVRPTDQQRDAFNRLDQATKDAVKALEGACPDTVPATPVGRLDAMEQRLAAMSKAAQIVQPALQEFYGSLSNEQKARFNTMTATASR